MNSSRAVYRPRIILPQWQLNSDPCYAIEYALKNGISHLALDFGDSYQGIKLDDSAEYMRIKNALSSINIPVLSVNHLDNLGIFTMDGCINDQCLELVNSALRFAFEFGIPCLHIPSLGKSMISNYKQLELTAHFLQLVADQAAVFGININSETTLDMRFLVTFVDLIERDNVFIVIDTGNLLDAGIRPKKVIENLLLDLGDAFYRIVSPCLHLRFPQRRPSPYPTIMRLFYDEIEELFLPETILLKNKYLPGSTQLDMDIASLVNSFIAERHTNSKKTLIYESSSRPRERKTEDWDLANLSNTGKTTRNIFQLPINTE